MDTRFSVAVHALVLVSQAEAPDGPITSARIATSTGTNASYVRKVMAGLAQAGIVGSHSGAAGYHILMNPRDVTLLAVHDAACGHPVHAIDMHRNPNDACVVGRHIEPVLTPMFAEAEDALRRALASRTLADCTTAMRARLTPAERAELNHGGTR
ncbi:Rrf2 family transcriptional regulator [Actinomyces sp. 565]|uniref:RrF2 family transcriptional regulator n=1 Tax=Actinomyces sp. 565 TaxID=2057794 RepID=UPI0013A6C320|nr:Rrf2 family transcriptional regulator [Actinomyces sp. 565]NDR54278.1 Rrf2 family transcriptional regulator [Actinomyces sp. 565]